MCLSRYIYLTLLPNLTHVEHPPDPELVEAGAPVGAPRHLLQPHRIRPAIAKRGIQTIRFFAGVRLEVEGGVVATRSSCPIDSSMSVPMITWPARIGSSTCSTCDRSSSGSSGAPGPPGMSPNRMIGTLYSVPNTDA